jgi:hypothetical protein
MGGRMLQAQWRSEAMYVQAVLLNQRQCVDVSTIKQLTLKCCT